MKSVYLRKIFIMINFQGIFVGIHAPPPPRKYFQNLLSKVYYPSRYIDRQQVLGNIFEELF